MKNKLSHFKGRTFQEIYGKERAECILACRRVSVKGFWCKEKRLEHSLLMKTKETHTLKSCRGQSRFMKRLWKDSKFRKNFTFKNKGKLPWNKGLTKESDERVNRQAIKLFGHYPNKGSGRGKCGFRRDINMYVRSTWEANVVRVFRFLAIPFLYENKRFNLKDDTWLIDFYLPDHNLWVEVKGYVESGFRKKVEKFKRLHPEERLLVLDVVGYKKLEQGFKNKVVNWET